MAAVQIHTRAENGHVSFDLPAEHAALNNAKLVVSLMADTDPTPIDAASNASPTFPPTDREALATVVALNPFRDIKDPVQWQRDLRNEWERPLPGRP